MLIDKTMATKATQQNTDNKTKKQFRGVVVSDKMKDTVVVSVKSYFKHSKYKKYISRSKKFMAHDAGNTKKIGDEVTIEETRPMSKRKHFKVI